MTIAAVATTAATAPGSSFNRDNRRPARATASVPQAGYNRRDTGQRPAARATPPAAPKEGGNSLMLMPKRVKYRRVQRGRMKGKATRGNVVTYGEYGLMATEPCLDHQPTRSRPPVSP